MSEPEKSFLNREIPGTVWFRGKGHFFVAGFIALYCLFILTYVVLGIRFGWYASAAKTLHCDTWFGYLLIVLNLAVITIQLMLLQLWWKKRDPTLGSSMMFAGMAAMGYRPIPREIEDDRLFAYWMMFGVGTILLLVGIVFVIFVRMDRRRKSDELN